MEAKSTGHNPAKNEKGQLTIFLALSLGLVISLMAFIVNVGLFVKAKINLQNAVDAAAFSGASVQARQLTQIGYLNWEMRNTYKEWMFKYYILGQKGLKSTHSANVQNTLSAGDNMNFRLLPLFKEGERGYNPSLVDAFNVPSICIHYGSPHNICGLLSLPGLPRFNTVGLPGISEFHESFINTLVSTKANDCSARSNINFGAAMLWAYGTGTELFQQVPLIASHRPGAWVEAIELALRIRNLEMMVNLPPISAPICLDGSNCTPVSQLDAASGPTPLYERPIKAFWSAFRNLGGGKNKDDLSSPFVQTFKLTEIPPRPYSTTPNSLSGFLIPPTSIGQSGVSALTKHYLDLQAYPLNLATFYTTFVSSTGDFRNEGTVASEADCGGTKTALPVPGYIMGFTKNPEVLTYYAVKGEANFVGLFFPFTKTEGIKLSAYASAKPFGGRIGPRLFGIESNNQSITPRKGGRSTPYISALNIGPGLFFKKGHPIPFDDNFWVRNLQPIGGSPTSGNEIYFAIPNLLYDFSSSVTELSGHLSSGNPITTLGPAFNGSKIGISAQENKGLHDPKQFQLFAENQVSSGDVVLTAEQVDFSIQNARKPTRYEALNYLIPTLDSGYDNSGITISGNLDSPPILHEETRQNEVPYVNLYAPLFGPNTLYGTEISSITNILEDFIANNEKAVNLYLDGLKKVRDDIIGQSSRGGNSYVNAGDSIWRQPLFQTGAPGSAACQGLSMAQKFNMFIKGSAEECGIRPLKDSVVEYFNKKAQENSNYRNFFLTGYLKNPQISNSDLNTAFVPGPRQGADANGNLASPYGGPEAKSQRRNFYSAKFFAIEKVLNNSKFPFDSFSPYLEDGKIENPPGLTNSKLKNLLDATELDVFKNLPH